MFYIDNTEDLIAICKEIAEKSNTIAVDTEFTKQLEYFPKISIIQISFFNGEIIKNCIIDVLAENINLESLKEIFINKKIKKIFHSCSQDLEGLYKLVNQIPENIEDTQIMAEFCAMPANLSYVDLIKDTLGIIVKKDKKIQVSDWTIRPLSQQQLEYATGDVDYLFEIYIKLLQKLDLNKNYQYYRQEIEEKYNQNMMEKIIENSSWRRLRFKVGNKTNIYMEAFKAICRWREKIAIQHDIIKNKIFPDQIIKVLLDKKPQTLDEFNEVFKNDKEISNKPKVLKKTIINTYNKIFNKAETEKTEEKPYITELKDKKLSKKLEEISDYLTAECKKMEINPEIVHNKLDLIAYLTDSEVLEDLFYKWKIQLFGKRLEEIKNKN